MALPVCGLYLIIAVFQMRAYSVLLMVKGAERTLYFALTLRPDGP